MTIVMKRSEVFKALEKYTDTNQDMLLLKSTKKKLIADLVIAADIHARILVHSVTDGIVFTTYYGAKIPVRDKPAVLEVLNDINCNLVRGKFAIDKDNDLVFRDYANLECGIDTNEAILEMLLGVKLFHAKMGLILSAIKDDKDDSDEEFTIISEEDEDEQEEEGDDRDKN
ncbi:MAG: YbjN domain-containing protein [archaeon]|nr:YbjN domain-containing protein [archaeon]